MTPNIHNHKLYTKNVTYKRYYLIIYYILKTLKRSQFLSKNKNTLSSRAHQRKNYPPAKLNLTPQTPVRINGMSSRAGHRKHPRSLKLPRRASILFIRLSGAQTTPPPGAPMTGLISPNGVRLAGTSPGARPPAGVCRAAGSDFKKPPGPGKIAAQTPDPPPNRRPHV